jgi:hypothetical protein
MAAPMVSAQRLLDMPQFLPDPVSTGKVSASAHLEQAASRTAQPRRGRSGALRLIGVMAAAEKLDRGYLGRILQLALLAPDIVEDVLDGREGTAVGLPKLLRPLQVS